jgi:mannose-6-phosphate isomerase
MRRVTKPWGEEIIFAETDRYVGKILRVLRGESLSLQYHRRKDETLYLARGRMKLSIQEGGGMVERIFQPGDSCHIPPGTRHRLVAEEDSEVFEVSTPDLDDVVRLEDRYGRVGGGGGAAPPAGESH